MRAAMRRTAERMIAIRRGIGIDPQRFDHADPRFAQFRRDIGFQIELVVALPARLEIAFVRRAEKRGERTSP